MTIYTLYVKVHKITGLRYLGQTSKDPFKYVGSGIDWKKHLTLFGRHIDTILLLQTNNWEEIKFWGRHYSNLYRVLDAVDDFGDRIWANRILETGGGGSNDPQQRGQQIKDGFAAMGDDDVKRWRDNIKTSLNLPETKNKKQSSAKVAMNKPKTLMKLCDNTKYHFYHVSGIEECCTQRELRLKHNLRQGNIHNLISGRRKKHKGWIVKL